MPRRGTRKGSSDDLPPADRLQWARGIWAEGDGVAKTESGVWILREAGGILGLPEEAVDERIARSRER